MSINANNAALNEILETINNLPEADSGKTEIETTVDIASNGTTEVTPEDENTTFSKVTINVGVPIKEEQSKTIDITESGTITVAPDDGVVWNEVTVNTNVESGVGSDINELELLLTGALEEFSTEKEFTYKNNFFMKISSIKKISVPNAKGNSNYNFYGCVKLEYADIGKATSIQNAFYGCHNLKTIIIRKSDSITELRNSIGSNSNNLLNGITLIYVPRSLIEDYKAATNWTVFANQFRALEDYTVDGTITGKFDESKI